MADADGGVDVVVSGLAGRLPECDNIEQFAQQLLAGIDLVTADDRRWPPGLYGLPERSGKLNNLAHFDAAFFNVHPTQAHSMDPQLRILLELTHEAIVDAGYNPVELRGSKSGVYVGVSSSEAENLWTSDPTKITNGYIVTGCCRSMFANRISHCFDLKGPSFAINSACSSSMNALVQAVNDLRTGETDAAIVAGCNLCLRPEMSMNYHRLGMLSIQGRCAAFDAAVSGYVRSEAAVVLLLQRRSAARRVYATVRGAGRNVDGAKIQGVTYPAGEMQQRLAEETFRKADLDPKDVVYLEAHGTGTKVGDSEEVNAIANVFCKGRKVPLLIGSVKSNMGHSEAASGLCSVAKVLVAMERGTIPGNLHFNVPNPNIPSLNDGRIRVVDRNIAWEGGLVAVNSFGFGGANAHIILESGKPRGACGAEYVVPRLVLASGRTEEAARALLALAAEHPRDAHLHALLDQVHEQAVPLHKYRAFRLLADPAVEEVFVLPSDSKSRPIWFIFSGMGSQWAGMGRVLLQLPGCAASFQRCAAALEPLGVDLINLLTDAPETAFDNIISAFVCITAVQIALVDLLRAANIYPDGMVGHSAGEMGCAYADNTLSAEQTILVSYWRGRSIVDSKTERGAMAVIGLSWKQCAARLPTDVELACDNAVNSVTVSGPVHSVEKFIADLSAEGIFARNVKCAGVAAHSKYIAAAAPFLRHNLERIITEPKPRSSKWLSSSLPREQWDSQIAQLSDAEYHVNNLLLPVRFADALRAVPERALLVEVAPHALLQAVLKSARPAPAAAYVPLVRRDSPDPCAHLLAALGRLFGAGAQPRLAALYPRVQWPVRRGTPGLASRVLWDHSVEWSVPTYQVDRSPGNVVEYDLSTAEDTFLLGHNIDGRVLFPASGYLTLVWKILAKLHSKNFEETPVVFDNVEFKRVTIMTSDHPVRFVISIIEGTDEFFVSEGGEEVVRGRVRMAKELAATCLPPAERLPPAVRLPLAELLPPAERLPPAEPGLLPLLVGDVYKELRLRGYNYSGVFQGIKCSDPRGTEGTLAWNNNWISFMDTMLQFSIIGINTRDQLIPTYVQRVTIDPINHLVALSTAEGVLPVNMQRDIDTLSSGGIEFRGIKTSLNRRRENTHSAPKLETYTFQPYDTEKYLLTKYQALTVNLQLVIENIGELQLKIMETAFDSPSEKLLLPLILDISESEPCVRVDAYLAMSGQTADFAASMVPHGIKMIHKDARAGPPDINCHLVVAANVLTQHGSDVLQHLVSSLSEAGMVLLEEPVGVLEATGVRAALATLGLGVVAHQVVASGEYVLVRRQPTLPSQSVLVELAEEHYGWVDSLRAALKRAEHELLRVYAVSYAKVSGILGLGACLRAEPGGRALRVFHLPGACEPFNPDAAEYAQQVAADLAVNVRRSGVWGSYRHLTLKNNDDARQQVKHAYVNTLSHGDLSSLRWVEGELPAAAELCHVYYAPLNFRDVMFASGKLPREALPKFLVDQECALGIEFSGRSSEGKRVMGIVAARGLATTLITDRSFTWEVPATWSLEEAATVPVAYATAYYALCVRGRMRRGEAVLVHAGAGGVGQAAIAVALHAGCSVFATVGTPDKRAFLRERFPALPPENIANSRDTSFEQLVLRRTRGRGVDLVLNSLAGDKLLASVRCLAQGGRFLEIGKLDLVQNTALGMSVFLKNSSYHGIFLDALHNVECENEEKQAIVRCLNDGIASGAVCPLPSTVFKYNQIEQAFRYMAAGKHIGKVVVRVREEEAGPACPTARLVPAAPRPRVQPGRSYVLVGGLGGVGLELAHWLVSRGARALVLNSRSGVRTGYQSWCIRRWRERGVRVAVSRESAAGEGGARALLREAAALAPVGGVFNLAAVLRDAYFENLTLDDFQAVAVAKINVTKALDIVTRDLAPNLDYFVVFSSLSSGRGNPGQSNYGLANSAMERIMEQRQADGLPGLAVQWGAIGEVGIVMRTKDGEEAVVAGTVPQPLASCMQALGSLLRRPHAVAACMVLAARRRAAAAPQHDITHVVARILGMRDPTKVTDTTKLAELGMDSIMGAEIKQVLERQYDVVLGLQEIRGFTFAKLRKMAASGAPAPAPSAAQGAPLVPTRVVEPLPSAAGAPGAPAVFMLPGVEGAAAPLRALAAGVRAPVLALQCPPDAPLGDLPALARFYVSRVRALQPRPPYTLLGYSYGAAVAFEMALQLEQVGDKVRVVLVDGSPAYVTSLVKRGFKQRSTRSASTFESDVLAYFALGLIDIDGATLTAELEVLGGWEERLRRTVELVARSVPHSAEEVAAAATSFYRKLVVGDSYRPAGRLRAPVSLFTASDNYVTLDDDYGLAAVCTGPLVTRRLPGNHRSVLAGAAARIIADHVSDLMNPKLASTK